MFFPKIQKYWNRIKSIILIDLLLLSNNKIVTIIKENSTCKIMLQNIPR